MANGVNKVFLLGHLGTDPELRYTPNQNAVCNLSIATTERRKGVEGEWNDHTEWHKVVVWGKIAENCSNYLSKGRQVFVEGRIQTEKWEDKEGNSRYTTKVIANSVQFVGGKGDSASGGSSYEQFSTQKQSSQADETSNFSTAPSNPQNSQTVALEDDDIPF